MEHQTQMLARKDLPNSIFSIDENCQTKECLPVLENCQQNCGQIYSIRVLETKSCINDPVSSKQESILLSYFALEGSKDIVKITAQKDFLNQKLDGGKIVDRIWLWINFPKTKKEIWNLLEIGP